jgi:hypothetical protein
MSAAPVAHVGILVSDVVAARNNWSKALGGTHVEPAYLNGFSLRYQFCTEVTR